MAKIANKALRRTLGMPLQGWGLTENVTMQAKKAWFGPNELAKLLGITVKALRVYEREGLLIAGRTEADWRVYGPQHVERLHLILAMRDFGLSLKRIKVLLDDRQSDLNTLLTVQQELLEMQRHRINRGIALLSAARNRLRKGHSLSLDDLIHLTKESRMQKQASLLSSFETRLKEQFPQVAEAALAHINQTISEAAIPTLNYAGAHVGKDLSELKTHFELMMAQAADLMAKGDETSEPAKALVRKWNAHSFGLPTADKALSEAIQGAFMAAVEEKQTGKPVLFDPEVFNFVLRVAKGMRKRGEL